VEKILKAQSEETSPYLMRMARKIISNKGKLIRPGVLLLITRHLGYRGNKDVTVAAAVEAIHVASLIHDDIIDGSVTRRGSKTALKSFGADFSLLLGDFFFIRSVYNSLSLNDEYLPKLITRVAQRMIEGEIEELVHSYNFSLSQAEYMRIIEKKTASLFETTCKLACHLGKASRKEREALDRYGLNLGLVFQIIDDLIDLVGQPSETGKTGFSDLKEGRITLPVILALKKASPETALRLKNLLRKTKSGSEKEDFSTLLNVVKKTGALDLAFLQAEALAAKAREAALILKPSPYRKSLLDLIDFVLIRRG
jgi:octaprenyl-diphosphate synthase